MAGRLKASADALLWSVSTETARFHTGDIGLITPAGSRLAGCLLHPFSSLPLSLCFAIWPILPFAGQVKIIDRKKNLALTPVKAMDTSSDEFTRRVRFQESEVKLKGGEYVALEMINVRTAVFKRRKA